MEWLTLTELEWLLEAARERMKAARAGWRQGVAGLGGARAHAWRVALPAVWRRRQATEARAFLHARRPFAPRAAGGAGARVAVVAAAAAAAVEEAVVAAAAAVAAVVARQSVVSTP